MADSLTRDDFKNLVYGQPSEYFVLADLRGFELPTGPGPAMPHLLKPCNKLVLHFCFLFVAL